MRSAMLHGSKMWCLRENEVAILRGTERSMSEGNVGCKVGGQEEYSGADGHARIEESSR